MSIFTEGRVFDLFTLLVVTGLMGLYMHLARSGMKVRIRPIAGFSH